MADPASPAHLFSPPAATHEPLAGPPLPAFAERTVSALVRDRAQRFGARAAVRFRGPSGKWQDLSFAELDQRRRSIAAGLASLGVGRGDRVLVLSHNSAEMFLAELAILSLGAVSTPIFPDYSSEILLHCLRDSGARVALCGTAAQQRKIEDVAGGQLERLVVLDGQPMAIDSRAVGLEALERLAHARGPVVAQRTLAAVDAASESVRAEEPAFLIYTSGTTARPKGVPLTHRNVLSQQAAIRSVWTLGPDDVLLAYLPWHHCFGSLFERLLALWNGALLVIDDSRGRDLDRLLANFAEVKPTLYLSVPRVYQALVARAQADAAAKAVLLHKGLRFVFTAAAPLPDLCYRFFQEAGVPVHEGWGLTEASPCCTLTRPDLPRRSGAVGWPLPGTEVRLEPVEMVGASGVGEVLVRGPQVMDGYHRNPEASRKVLTGDGWLRTGDLGNWTSNGLQIRGRVDGVFKLLNGEKVPSGEVEARLLAATPLLEQAVVLGAGQPFTTALCWLNLTAARRFVEERSLWPDVESPDDVAGPAPLAWLVLSPEIRRAITEALQAANSLAAVSYERVRRVALSNETLLLETGELTPTLKAVRRVVMERHRGLMALLAGGTTHPQILELIRAEDSLQNL